MDPYAIMHLRKVHDLSQINWIDKHNERKRIVRNADPALSPLNQRLVGSGDWLADVRTRLAAAPTIRSNGVLAIDTMMTASIPFFFIGSLTEQEQRREEWTACSLRWLMETFTADNVVAAILHRDESNCHMHSLVVPIDARGRLCSRSFLNDKRDRLRLLQDSYHAAVKHLGLARGVRYSVARHEDIRHWYGERIETARVAEHELVSAVKLDLPEIVEPRPHEYVERQRQRIVTSLAPRFIALSQQAEQQRQKIELQERQIAAQAKREEALRRELEGVRGRDAQAPPIELLQRQIEELRRTVERQQREIAAYKREAKSRQRGATRLPNTPYDVMIQDGSISLNEATALLRDQQPQKNGRAVQKQPPDRARHSGRQASVPEAASEMHERGARVSRKQLEELRSLDLETVMQALGGQQDVTDGRKWRLGPNMYVISGSTFINIDQVRAGTGAIDLVRDARNARFSEALAFLRDLQPTRQAKMQERTTPQQREWASDPPRAPDLQERTPEESFRAPVPQPQLGAVQEYTRRAPCARESDSPRKSVSEERTEGSFQAPAPAPERWDAVRQSLLHLSLPENVVDRLHAQGLLYSDERCGAVFLRQNDRHEVAGADLCHTTRWPGTTFTPVAGTQRDSSWFSWTLHDPRSERPQRPTLILVSTPLEGLSALEMFRQHSDNHGPITVVAVENARCLPHYLMLETQRNGGIIRVALTDRAEQEQALKEVQLVYKRAEIKRHDVRMESWNDALRWRDINQRDWHQAGRELQAMWERNHPQGQRNEQPRGSQRPRQQDVDRGRDMYGRG